MWRLLNLTLMKKGDFLSFIPNKLSHHWVREWNQECRNHLCRNQSQCSGLSRELIMGKGCRGISGQNCVEAILEEVWRRYLSHINTADIWGSRAPADLKGPLIYTQLLCGKWPSVLFSHCLWCCAVTLIYIPLT